MEILKTYFQSVELPSIKELFLNYAKSSRKHRSHKLRSHSIAWLSCFFSITSGKFRNNELRPDYFFSYAIQFTMTLNYSKFEDTHLILPNGNLVTKKETKKVL
jgi:hypothetical protein